RFLTVGNLINIARQISINLIIAVGMTFCIIGGGFDLSVGSVGAMSGVLTGLVLVETGSVSLGILSGLVAGTTAGLINGLCISRLKVNSFVTTLGMMVAARGVALILTGGDVILGFPEAFNFLGVGFIAGIPVPIIIAAAVTILGHLVLSRTEFGLNVYAVGGNYAAAKLAGLRNERIITMVFTAQGLLAALGGIVLMARVVSAQPALMQETNLDVIAAVVVGGTSLAGGRGGIGGTLLGSILLGTLFNGLNIVGIGYEWQLVAIGLIIVMAVAVDNLSRR
ncbi:ABC transporter permease, partial [Acidobacteria bacterium AH-259-G07]|nr:ABC transporter permease [Acidobacteria bacterium AH-259-G07]